MSTEKHIDQSVGLKYISCSGPLTPFKGPRSFKKNDPFNHVAK